MWQIARSWSATRSQKTNLCLSYPVRSGRVRPLPLGPTKTRVWFCRTSNLILITEVGLIVQREGCPMQIASKMKKILLVHFSVATQRPLRTCTSRPIAIVAITLMSVSLGAWKVCQMGCCLMSLGGLGWVRIVLGSKMNCLEEGKRYMGSIFRGWSSVSKAQGVWMSPWGGLWGGMGVRSRRRIFLAKLDTPQRLPNIKSGGPRAIPTPTCSRAQKSKN